MAAGFGRIAGSLGDVLFPPMMLGSWTGTPLAGDVGPYGPELPGGELEREAAASRMGEGIVAGRMGECPVEEPDETDVVRFLRLLPWLS